MRPEELGTYYESILDKEVRKESGIYYTPPPIVDDMVESSLGEILKDKTSEESTTIKIVDPACGGGVFLLGAYQFLLDWYEKHFGKLTLKQRRKVLTDNIFGVDIDPLAVEITKYCLSMKCSEGKDNFLDLSKNIRCGNSLVETEFCWSKEFSKVFKRGGFDIVIGNPPYNVIETKNPLLDYYRKNFRCTAGGKVNLYKLFFEKGLSLIKDKGLLVYITPYNYLTSADSIKLREILLNETTIIEIVDYEESQKVFESATQAVATIVTRKQLSADYRFQYKKLGETYTLKSKEINCAPRLMFKGSNQVIKRMNLWKKTFDYFIEGYQGEINVSTKKNFFVDKNQKGDLPLIRGNQIGYYETVAKPVEFCPVSISTRSHHSIRRIAFQAIANVGSVRRIKGVIIENMLCGHSVNYMFSKHEEIPLEALLGVLNSRLVNYYFKFYNQTNNVPIGEIKMIPVLDCLFTSGGRLAKLVTRRLNGELLDETIDAFVYELYGLSNEEIAIIEGR